MPKIMGSAPNAGGRHQRGRRGGPTLSEINVIPLVDVMLVLLVIFMVAAPMLQRGIEVNLPVTSRSQEIAAERVFLDVPASFRQDRRVVLNKEPIRLQLLAERIKQRNATATDKQVFIRSDGHLQVQDLIDVLGELKAAGSAGRWYRDQAAGGTMSERSNAVDSARADVTESATDIIVARASRREPMGPMVAARWLSTPSWSCLFFAAAVDAFDERPKW